MQKEEAYVLFAHVSVVYRTASWNILSETICRQLYVPSSSGVGGEKKKSHGYQMPVYQIVSQLVRWVSESIHFFQHTLLSTCHGPYLVLF